MLRYCGILIILISWNLQAQKIYWSDITQEDVLNAGEAVRSFLSQLEKHEPDSIRYLFSEDSVFIGKGKWSGAETLSEKLIGKTQGISFEQVKLSGFRFDDFLESFQQDPMIQEVFPVFDNHSVIIQVVQSVGGSTAPVYFVLDRENNSWRISGLTGFGLVSENDLKNDLPGKGFRTERIAEAGIELPVPDDFSGPEKADGQVVFSLREKTERDAVFQILVDELKSKVHFYTYKFVEFTNQQHGLSDLVVRYLPGGILFEYTVTDPYGQKNKGITLGMQSGSKMVIVQFYAFYDIYLERRQEIMKVFRNVNTLNR